MWKLENAEIKDESHTYSLRQDTDHNPLRKAAHKLVVVATVEIIIFLGVADSPETMNGRSICLYSNCIYKFEGVMHIDGMGKMII